MLRKVAGPMRVDNGGTGTTRYRFTGLPGGSTVKVAQYMIKVLAASNNARVGLELEHEPDGEIYVLQSTVIAITGPAQIPGLLSGASGTPDTNPGAVLGEWLLPVVLIDTSDANPGWASIEVYEVRKSV